MLSVGRLRGRILVLAAVIVALLAGGTWFALTHAQAKQAGDLTAASGKHAKPAASAPPLQVVSVTPASHARHVNGADPVSIKFSAPLAAGSPLPTVSPATPGSWQRPNASTVEFVPAKGFAPRTHVTVRIPGGTAGVKSAAGGALAQPLVTRFRVGTWSTTRLDQLLAQLGYLPLTWTPAPGVATPAATDASAQRSAAFSPPAGTFSWLHGYPHELHTFWAAGPAGAGHAGRGDGLRVGPRHDHGRDSWDLGLERPVQGGGGQARTTRSGYTYALAASTARRP